jgi:amidase
MKRLSRDQTTETYCRLDPPALEVAPGETVELETPDAFGGAFRSQADVVAETFGRLTYPLTGPIHVAGAEPGDTLAVRVDAIELAERGVVLFGGGGAVLRDWMPGYGGRVVEVRDGQVVWDDRLRIPIRPMIGKIGTAPALECLRSSTAGRHGGNMDCPFVTTGSTILLPVEVPGALLSVGDVHAAMGDCEVGGTGVEIEARLRLTLDLRKGRPPAMSWPRIETADAILTLGAGRPLDEALYQATRDMLLWLEEEYGLDRADAYPLLSLAGHARPGNWFSAYYLMPRAHLPASRL